VCVAKLFLQYVHHSFSKQRVMGSPSGGSHPRRNLLCTKCGACSASSQYLIRLWRLVLAHSVACRRDTSSVEVSFQFVADEKMGWMAWTGLIWFAAGRGLARVQRPPFGQQSPRVCKMTILNRKNVIFWAQQILRF
jgi:hypothetical protein